MKRRKISFGESSGLMLTAFLIVMGLNVIGSILLSVISVVFAGDDMLRSITEYVLMLLFQAAYIGSYLSFKKSRKVRTVYEIRNKISFWAVCVSVIIAIVTFFGCIGPAYGWELLLEKFHVVSSSELSMGSVPELILVFVCTTIAAPIGEELVFRDALLSGMSEKRSVVSCSLMSATCFMLMHTNPHQTVYQFILGFVAAVTVMRFGSVVAGMIVHSVSNLLAILVSVTKVGKAADAFYAGIEGNALRFILLVVVAPVVAITVIMFVTQVVGKREKRLCPEKFDRKEDTLLWIDERSRKPIYDINEVPNVSPIETVIIGFDTQTGEPKRISRHAYQEMLIKEYTDKELRRKESFRNDALKIYLWMTCILWAVTFAIEAAGLT